MRFFKYLVLAAILPISTANAASGGNPNTAVVDLISTYNSRQCIIDHETRDYGPVDMYLVKNPHSSARGAYQWMDTIHHIWNFNLTRAEEYYQLRLTSEVEDANGARYYANMASPYAQDLVTAFVLINRPQNQRPWPYMSCWYKIGTIPVLRDDGPVNVPTYFIQRQIDYFNGVVPMRKARPLPPAIKGII